MTSGERLARAGRFARAAVRHPRLVALLADYWSRQDGQSLADVLAGLLSERELRRLTYRLLAREPMQITCDRAGFTITFDVADEIGESIYVEGRYSGDEIDAVLAWLAARGGTRPTIVEVGANVGTTTLPLARAGYRVVAIEPVISTFAMLSRNVAANGFADRVRCVNRAVSAAPGLAEMWVTNGSGLSELAAATHSPGFARIDPSFDSAKRRVTVETDRLDSLLSAEGVGAEDIALVWSDTQGSESYVVESGSSLWATGVPLYLEVAPWLLELHGGLDGFIERVEDNFARFLTREDLLRRLPPRDIGRFRAFASERGGIWFGDALLLPEPVSV